MGSSRISVMAVEILDSGEVRILSEEAKKSDEIKYGVVEQPSKCAFTINELTRLLQNSSRMSEIKKICVSLNAKTMKQIPLRISRSLEFGKTVTDAILEEMAAECEAKLKQQPEVEIYDIFPLYYELDGAKTDDPVNRKGSELIGFYNVIVGNASIKEELKRCFERTISISPNDFMPLGMEALSTVLLNDEERKAGCALINFGATTTTLAIYAEEVLQQLLVVPLGGKNITRDIQELGISEANAEKLKCLRGSALIRLVEKPIRIQIPPAEAENPSVKIETDFLATIIEARLAEIMVPILKAIEQTPFELNAGIVITGGGSKLNNLIDFLEEKTGIGVRFGSHTDWLSDDTDKRFADPIYAQSVGTALLLHDYMQENPEKGQASPTPPKGPQGTSNQKKKWGDKIKDTVGNGFLKLFNDENYLK